MIYVEEPPGEGSLSLQAMSTRKKEDTSLAQLSEPFRGHIRDLVEKVAFDDIGFFIDRSSKMLPE